MDFNVWRHRGDLAQSFLSEFMIFLRQKKILSSSTTDNIEKYAQQISNAHYSISLITSFLSLFHTEKTAQERYDEIADQIKISNIRIVVFLDDLDRLDNWSKWNEVFALLRA